MAHLRYAVGVMRCFFLWSLAFAVAPAIAQTNCSPETVAKTAVLVHQRQAELLKGDVEKMSSEVPAPLRVPISVLKDALVVAADTALRCAPPGEDAAALESRLARLLDANQPEKPFVPQKPGAVDTHQDSGAYGGDLKVSVSTPANFPSLRVVELTYGIECGSDTLMLIYEIRPEGWRRTMRWQSGAYKEISEAFGDMFLYSVLPAKEPGGMQVVVAHGTPWCTSRFSNFKVDVLAPTASGDAPRVVWHLSRNYSRGDFATRLRATDDGFELRLNASAMDSTGYERTVIYRYKVAGDQVTRIPPIATNGRGFVEEWMSMPWDEAQGQTAPEALAAMKALHERLERADKNEKTYVSYTYGPVRACSVKGRYEVEMDADPGGRQFYAIQEGSNGYAMLNFGTTRDERCSGPDLAKRR